MVITKDLGAVSAYAYAVEQGYQGTEEEFAELMARQASVAEEAAASADAAAESASEAQASAEQTEQSATAAANSASAAATSASNAAASATAAQTAKTAAETAQGKAEDAQAAAEAAAQSVSESAAQIAKNTDNFASAFSASTTYAIGDYCVYNGSLYKAVNAHTGAWNAADFEEVTVAGELEEIAETLENKANIDIGSIGELTYYQLDFAITKWLVARSIALSPLQIVWSVYKGDQGVANGCYAVMTHTDSSGAEIIKRINYNDFKQDTIKGVGVYTFADEFNIVIGRNDYTLSLYDADDELIRTDTCTPVQIAETILTKKDITDEQKHFYQTFVYACNQAQVFSNYNSDGLTIPEEYKAATVEDINDYKAVPIETSVSGVEVKSVTQELVSSFNIRLYFKITEGSVSDYTCYVDDEIVTPELNGDRYYISHGWSIFEFGDYHTYTIEKDGERISILYSFNYMLRTYIKSSKTVDHDFGSVMYYLWLASLGIDAVN